MTGEARRHAIPIAGPEAVAGVLGGERRAVARLISVMERGGEAAREAVSQLYSHTGRAHILGITGAPGTGKSTLVAQLAKAYLRRDQSVGIIAVDPTSPFTGGALLGDRVRMPELVTDPRVFIRSMATRGNLGGLARATADAVHVLDAAGFPVVVVETVGAGQSEVDVARVADTTAVLQMPSSGDEIQAIKAGILEIADIVVVNKADLAGADNMVAALQTMLDLRTSSNRWHHGRAPQAVGTPSDDTTKPAAWAAPVLKTSALHGQGIEDLLAAIDAHREFQRRTGLLTLRERKRASATLSRILSDELLARVVNRLSEADWTCAVDSVVARREDPYSVASRLIVASGLEPG